MKREAKKIKETLQNECVHILRHYLSHEFEESCHHSNRATGLFGVSDRRQVTTLQKSRPLIQCSFQRLAQLLKENKYCLLIL